MAIGTRLTDEILHFARLCEKSESWFDELTMSGLRFCGVKYLAVHPETRMRDVELHCECFIGVQWLKFISHWTQEARRWEAKLSSLAITMCLPDSMWTREVSR